ncbi:hypothetical protein [Rathayibacter festucae]|uniref:hypothetical protein n=1 Tax=Rathayibacter festucae TaxID=110937 RepID=UPI002A6AFA26|nr:hypothetical protein [Rathayibacter festucae]MDY0913869.1 hypothetical protein [Rathayibacter festucae]
MSIRSGAFCNPATSFGYRDHTPDARPGPCTCRTASPTGSASTRRCTARGPSNADDTSDATRASNAAAASAVDGLWDVAAHVRHDSPGLAPGRSSGPTGEAGRLGDPTGVGGCSGASQVPSTGTTSVRPRRSAAPQSSKP